MSFLGKEYKVYKKENCDDLLKYLGVPEDQLEAVNSFNPTEKFEKNGDTYVYYTQEVKGPVEVKFKSGEEFDYVLMDEPTRTTIVVDGNTVTQTTKSAKNVTVYKREFNGDELVGTFSAEGFDGAYKFHYKAI
ncbi:unnamed protein product [Arctia plantaginis]|uniref:Uncharacterized protein n=1 Tax=Arctia plantaginis TaxID=874455 RepID=A0A8S1ALU9_ARCPL|nr:unnamed protein product [Arctia plantaginis]